jgi:hypothetical protein
MRKLALVLSAAPVLLLTATASAHFNLEMPPPPAPSTDGKGAPPCGPDITDGTITPVTGGSDMTVAINETIDHGGFYRVALALTNCKKGAQCFPADNKVYDKNNMLLNPTGPGTSDHADYDMNPKFPILADHLFAHPLTGTAKKYSGMVPIPNLNCDHCTLQVIEFMEQHGPNGSAGYFYHHCAELKITADPNKPMFDPNNMGGAGGAGGGGAGGGAGMAGAGGGGAGSPAGGMGGAGGTGPSNGGAGSGTTSTAGMATGGMTTSMAGATTAGSGTAMNPGAGSTDDGGCGIARRAQGGASALAALGLLLSFVRRRRSR